MIAYNLYDGELLAKGVDNRAAKKCAAFAMKDKPNILEFLGYTFCFSNLLAGPATEFMVYEKACDGSIFKMKDGTFKKPNNFFATLRPFVESFIAMGMFLFLGGKFPLLDPSDPQNGTPVILTEAFLKKPFLVRYFHAWMGLLGVRQKYYFGWKNAEGAQNIWYAGFDGWDDKGEPIGWETSSNVDVLGFELASDVQNMSKNWNKKTSFWLTRYVYMRTGGSLLAVYSMSAFWHGFYPGYYIFFLSVPIATICDRLAKKKLSPFIPPSSAFYPIYTMMGTLSTTVTINYMILPFVLLAGTWSIEAYTSFYYFGHVGCVVFYAALSCLPTPKKQDKKKTA
jgi:D-alanyl-lipoteichoic acid acyltransferase DltB (MBOAT superfamily)